MAFTAKSLNDHIFESVGQESEAANSSKTGITVGEVYNATPPTIADGEFSRAQVDASGNLLVNLAAGEVVASVTNMGTIKEVTTVASVTGIGTLTNIGTVKGIDNVASVTGLGGTVVQQPVNSVASFLGTVTVALSGTAGTLANTIVGLTRYLTMVVPDTTGTGTTIIELLDSKGGTLFASGDKADSSVTTAGTIVPMTTDMKWVVRETAGTQAGAMDIVLDVHYER